MTSSTLPAPTAPVRTLYSSRTSLYELMIRLLGYRQGLTRFCAGRLPAARPERARRRLRHGAATLALHTALSERNMLPARFL
ncbi:hypothetical protein SAMN00120144_0728 [Hymenobacter roseosalivarius DSM 11622]|uniref:Uncharacterized protein n=1 Tax=Hymenobacter roseosalivarius DSM 11622 TaxID=645990 RepID=A0A1W1UQY8_9BACT|nr:hypothetical protein [Hymenobacter roseosalivarius]SMB83558.1 hypothetical protein SAMN00120144_0728 [Hymenobacter roseosalivarius DSM 11622]